MWNKSPGLTRARNGARPVRTTAALLGALMLSAIAPEARAQECRAPAGAARAAILDAVRTPVASDLRTAVEFRVERARLCGPWAFVLATPQKPGGGAIRWAGTPCEGDTSHLVGALLRRKSGGWAVVDYALCPSDVAWVDWPQKYNAPAVLFEE